MLVGSEKPLFLSVRAPRSNLHALLFTRSSVHEIAVFEAIGRLMRRIMVS